MANTATTARSVGARAQGGHVERLRSLTDTEVTITTDEGTFSGSVLSCTRLSVWLICDDIDLVIAVDDIVEVVAHELAA